MRNPSESLLSNAQLFPERSALDHIRSWLMSLRLVVCGLRLFPQSRVVDQSWIGISIISSLERALGIELTPNISDNWFQADSSSKYKDIDKVRNEYVLAHLKPGKTDEVFEVLDECERLYQYFSGQLDRERLQIAAFCNPATLDTSVVGPITKLLSRLDRFPLKDSMGWQMISGDGRNKRQGMGKPDTLSQLNYMLRKNFAAPQPLGISIERIGTEQWVKSGVDALQREAGFEIRARTDHPGSKHIGFYTVVTDRKIYTLTAAIRPGTCNKVMIQFGSASDFVKVAVDLRAQTLYGISGTRGAIPILALITKRGDGYFDLQLSALWINTDMEANSGVAVWLYLLSSTGDLEYSVAGDYQVNLINLVLSGASEKVLN